MSSSPALSRSVPQSVILQALASGPGQYRHLEVVFYVVPGPTGLVAILPGEHIPVPGG
ncbi:MAG: hypothetical protein AB7N24_22015 [Dehalococcoidia bacterium]